MYMHTHASLMSPYTKILNGLISPCTMPLFCKYCITSATFTVEVLRSLPNVLPKCNCKSASVQIVSLTPIICKVMEHILISHIMQNMI